MIENVRTLEGHGGVWCFRGQSLGATSGFSFDDCMHICGRRHNYISTYRIRTTLALANLEAHDILDTSYVTIHL